MSKDKTPDAEPKKGGKMKKLLMIGIGAIDVKYCWSKGATSCRQTSLPFLASSATTQSSCCEK